MLIITSAGNAKEGINICNIHKCLTVNLPNTTPGPYQKWIYSLWKDNFKLYKCWELCFNCISFIHSALTYIATFPKIIYQPNQFSCLGLADIEDLHQFHNITSLTWFRDTANQNQLGSWFFLWNHSHLCSFLSQGGQQLWRISSVETAWRCDRRPLIYRRLWRSEERLCPYRQSQALLILKQWHLNKPRRHPAWALISTAFVKIKSWRISQREKWIYCNHVNPGHVLNNFKVILIGQPLSSSSFSAHLLSVCWFLSILTNTHHVSHFKCWNIQNAILYPSAAALLTFLNWCEEMIQLPQRNLMLVKFSFLVNLWKKEEAAWLSCKLILLFTLASFLFSQGLRFVGDWALHSFLSLLHQAHGQQMLAVCVPARYWLHNSLVSFR